MKRLAAITSGLTLAAALVAGCGGEDSSGSGGSGDSGGSGGDYCGEVEGAKDAMQGFSGTDATLDDMSGAVDELEGVAEVAPDDISSDWDTLASGLGSAVSGLEDAGLPADKPLSEATQDLNANEQKKLSTAMQDMGTEDVQKAAENIEKQVKDECDIELSDSGGSSSSQ